MHALNACATQVASPLACGPDFDVLLDDIRNRAQAGEFNRQRHISPDVIESFKQHGVYRALVPERFGGLECSPAEFCRLIERISQADGSAGWVASFGMSPVYLAALPLDSIAQLYADGPDLVFAGGIFPPQPAEVVSGGFMVSGRWKYSSGSLGADVVGVGIAPKNGDTFGLPRIAVMPRSAIRIEETWDTVGLLGTGSHDLVVQNVRVAEEWTFVRGGLPNLDEPFFRYPSLSFATQVLSVVGLGVARAALDALADMASGRVSADLRAARAFFYESIDRAWDYVLAGDAVPVEATNLLRLSSTHMLSGMSGVYNDSPLARCVNDAQVVTQHAFMGDITYQNAGAMFFGKQPLPGYL